MTREQKISLIVGFTLVLLVGVAVSDHLSAARSAQLESGLSPADEFEEFDAMQRPIPDPRPFDTIAAKPEPTPETRTQETPPPSGPIARSLEDAMKPATDFLEQLRNRVQDMPLAAETVKKPENQSKPQLIHPAPKSDVAAGGADVQWYSVEEGDTLWSIAEKHYGDGALAAKLAVFNDARPDLIRSGVRLRIPPRHALTGEPAPARPTVSSSPAKAAPVATRDYTVKPGDTLGLIAQRELGTVKRLGDIMKLNPKLADADSIRVGDVIKLPSR